MQGTVSDRLPINPKQVIQLAVSDLKLILEFSGSSVQRYEFPAQTCLRPLHFPSISFLDGS